MTRDSSTILLFPDPGWIRLLLLLLVVVVVFVSAVGGVFPSALFLSVLVP